MYFFPLETTHFLRFGSLSLHVKREGDDRERVRSQVRLPPIGSVKMYARRATWSRDFTATRGLHLVGLGVSLAFPFLSFILWLAVMERSISANTYGGIKLGRM
jgi:hypothetical protein